MTYTKARQVLSKGLSVDSSIEEQEQFGKAFWMALRALKKLEGRKGGW